MSQSAFPASNEPSEKKRTKLVVWVVIIGIILVICVCVLAAAAVIYFDPFNWGLLGRVSGGYDSIVYRMPEDIDMYISADFLQLYGDNSTEFINMYLESLGDPDIQDREDAIANWDQQLQDELGITFTDDIRPWIGQYIGIGIRDVSLNSTDLAAVGGEVVLAMETRNPGKSDEFFDKMITYLSESDGRDVEMVEENGLKIIDITDKQTGQHLFYVRKDMLVYVATDKGLLYECLYMDKSDSLGETMIYKDLISKLEPERIATIFFYEDLWQSVNDSISIDISLLTTSLETPVAYGGAVILSSPHLRIEGFNYHDEGTSFERIDEVMEKTNYEDLAWFSDETVLLLKGIDFASQWELTKDLLGASRRDIEDSLQLLELQIGINPDTDLFPLLDGEYYLVFENTPINDSVGLIDLPIGISGFMETSNPSALQQSVQESADFSTFPPLFDVESISGSENDMYALTPLLSADPIMVFGYDANHFMISTESSRFVELPSENKSLINQSGFRLAWDYVEMNYAPRFFYNTTRLGEFLNNIDQAKFVSALNSIVVGSGEREGLYVPVITLITLKSN